MLYIYECSVYMKRGGNVFLIALRSWLWDWDWLELRIECISMCNWTYIRLFCLRWFRTLRCSRHSIYVANVLPYRWVLFFGLEAEGKRLQCVSVGDV